MAIIATSPWFITLTANSKFDQHPPKRLTISDQHFIDNVNSLRGQLDNPKSIASRLVVNKYVFFGKEMITRYFDSFDPSYLFFTGDPDITKSSHFAGTIYVSLLPFLILSLLHNKRLALVVLVSALPPIFVLQHYETISRIPFLVVLSLVAAIGMAKMLRTNKTLLILLLLLLTFEVLRFLHNFTFHYPTDLARLIFNS